MTAIRRLALCVIAALTVLRLITLHGPDDLTIDVNPDQITTVREPRGQDRVVHKDANCILFLTDGKFIAVTEDCATVRGKINDLNSED